MKDLGVENGTVVFQNPHNDWILLLSEIGFLGFICYFLFYVYGVYIAFKNIIYQEDKKIKLINLLILSTWIGLFVIHSADFPLERIEHQVLIYTMYAIVMYSYSLRSKVSTSRKAQFGRIFSIFFFLISIFSSIVGFNRWQSEKEMKEIKELMATNRWDLVLEKSRKLENVFYTMDPTTMPIDWYTGVAFFNLQQYSVALAYFKKAYEINPYNVHVISNYAACYTKLNALGKATELYKKGLLISPRFDDLRLNLCVVYYKQAMYKEAMNCLLNCAYDKYSSDARFRSYVIEVTRAYLGNKQMLPSSAEKYFVSLKNT
jgi:tetratricopeptide (TPR) repeat protein